MCGTWYLVDGKYPMKCKAKTILATSSQRKDYQNFENWIGTKKLYMPVWIWDEISACISKSTFNDLTGNSNIPCKVLFPKVDDKKVKELFKIWEGVPQIVL
ncbi:12247_t:CDS:2 [Funneliformis mosseae]|uniref:12247_t:CDS:1 n=1 Tax=Funneliformis mosseae TaxID=27381 RepID=A0A9N9B4J6_FUNMO|nr:12247_t:CDS:2 [Funneliformis mosseae]